MRPNLSANSTRYGSRRLTATGANGIMFFEANCRLPPRSGRLTRWASHTQARCLARRFALLFAHNLSAIKNE